MLQLLITYFIDSKVASPGPEVYLGHIDQEKEPVMASRPPVEPNEFGHLKNEWLLFILCAIREARRAFEAAVSSKWMALWITCVALGSSASWQLIKTHLFR